VGSQTLKVLLVISPEKFLVTRGISIRESLMRLESCGEALLILVSSDGVFERTITDGDIRRLLLGGRTFDDTLEQLPDQRSYSVGVGTDSIQALAIMNQKSVNHLPVLDQERRVVSIYKRSEIDDRIMLSPPHLGELERSYVNDAFSSNWIAPLGPNVDAFETEVASYVGVNQAAALSSGTAAIHLGLVLLGVGSGDTVICSDLTFAASAFPIKYLGAIPVFVDSDPESWNMSPKALEMALHECRKNGRLPKAVIVVNLYGQSANMDRIREVCSTHKIPILEDAAESLGAKYKGRSSGGLGDVGVFSFNGNKIITTSGGGMLVSDNEKLIERARFLSTQARENKPYYHHLEIGYNYRMSNLLAGVGRGQLRLLDERVKARRRIFGLYKTGLADIEDIQWMPEPEWSFSSRWLSTGIIASDSKITPEHLFKKLAKENIEARQVWKPMHLQPVFSGCSHYSSFSKPFSTQLFKHGVCLPSGTSITDNQITRVIEIIRSTFMGSRS